MNQDAISNHGSLGVRPCASSLPRLLEASTPTELIRGAARSRRAG
jgi:hypothetical protein